MKIEYQEIDMERLIAYFVDGYEMKPENYDWFYDPAKKKMIIRLYLAETKGEKRCLN